MSDPISGKNLITTSGAKKLGEVVTWYKGHARGHRGSGPGGGDMDRPRWLLASAAQPIGQGGSGNVTVLAGTKGQETSTGVTLPAFSHFYQIQTGEQVLIKAVDQGYEIYAPPPPNAAINLGPPCTCQPCMKAGVPVTTWIINRPYEGLALGNFANPSGTYNGITFNSSTDPVTLTFPAQGSTPSFSYTCPQNQWSTTCPNTLTLSAPQGVPSGYPCSICAMPTNAIYDGFCSQCPTVTVPIADMPGPYSFFNGTYEIPTISNFPTELNYYTCAGQFNFGPDYNNSGIQVSFTTFFLYQSATNTYIPSVYLQVSLGYVGTCYGGPDDPGPGPLVVYQSTNNVDTPLPCMGSIPMQPTLSRGIPGSPTEGGNFWLPTCGNLYSQMPTDNMTVTLS